jgi:predicted ATPase/DNA-binding SARP family transcriptional activator
MKEQWKIELFGLLQAQQEDRIIARFRTQKTGLLLAYLAYHYHRSHSREQLISMLWPDVEIEAGRRSLSVALSSLRHQMEPPSLPAGTVIIADRSSIQLNPVAITTDVSEFKAAIRSAAGASSSQEQVRHLAAAVELYRGELLAGYYEDWVLAERERLADEFLGALVRLIAHLERAGDYSRALRFVRQAISAEPLREELHRDLMRLYTVIGQPSAALQHYYKLEQLLRDELGVAPDAATQELAGKIEAQRQQQPDSQTIAASPDQPTPSVIAIESVIRAYQPLPLIPGGTVTFLLIDAPGSADFWRQAEQAFTAAMAKYQSLLRSAFQRHGGRVIGEADDSFRVAFARASDAVAAAVEVRRALRTHQWPVESGAINESPIEARMALHTGEVGIQETDYSGSAIDLGLRLLSAAHGGQIICSEATAALLARDLEPGLKLIELGIFRLRGVEMPERVFQILHSDMAQRVWPPLKAEPSYPSTLPLQLTRFFGRDWELARLQRMFLKEGARLVTVTGPGGTGKTRLALELARHLIEPLRGAVWFVPLAELSDPQLIAGAVLDAMRVDRVSSLEPTEQLIAALSRQPVFLILDNFEQLTAGAAIIQTLLERAATLKCVVASRQRLSIEGECEFPLLPLPIPDRADAPERLILNESVRLFVDRAQAVKPDFQVTKANAADVAELCKRLEGIPLAIELATARVQVLTPAQMIARFDERFDLLLNRKRGVASRHRSLRAALDWSYELLTPELQRFFAELSVFRGGWTLEAAEEVCQQPHALDYLTGLRECSLIATEEDEFGMRFRMLETLREYASGRLDPDRRAMLGQRHAEFYLALAERAEPELRGPKQAEWLKQLSIEYDNLQSVLDWSKASCNIQIGLQVGCDIWRFGMRAAI